MADSNGLPANLDLDAILATLAGLQQKPQEEQARQYPSSRSQEPFQPPQESFPQQQQQQQQQEYTPDPRLAGRTTIPKPQAKSSASAATPLIDPATIIDWKQGLRCVSKIAALNPEFAGKVRRLVKEQEGNVRVWEEGRRRMVEEQAMKREGEERHRAALSLPGLLENTPALRTPEREQEELEQYDAKVYRASKAMVEMQSSSLKVLGVPFFGVRAHLMASEGEEVERDGEGSPRKVTQSQVLELQRRMLTHLLDLYGD
ncbi:hypothetical protein G6514_005924 [Epicoccum nigrum]|nr:hypothetical protein G6514_005924 [Epicoccum nigrum]